MNLIRALSCIIAVLMTAPWVHADTTTYDFDDGTSQGWTNDVKAGSEFVSWNTADDDNGGQFIAYSGDFAMRIEDFGARDGTTDLLLITSPEFKIATATLKAIIPPVGRPSPGMPRRSRPPRPQTAPTNATLSTSLTPIQEAGGGLASMK